MRCTSMISGLTLAIVGAVSGCGSPPLAPANEISGLHFSTSAAFPTNPAPAVDISLTDPTPARAIYRATLALPAFPSGIHRCPVDGGVRYTILFTGDESPALTTVLNPGGCGDVTITGSYTRWNLGHDYWDLLAQNLGIEVSVIYPY